MSILCCALFCGGASVDLVAQAPRREHAPSELPQAPINSVAARVEQAADCAMTPEALHHSGADSRSLTNHSVHVLDSVLHIDAAGQGGASHRSSDDSRTVTHHPSVLAYGSAPKGDATGKRAAIPIAALKQVITEDPPLPGVVFTL